MKYTRYDYKKKNNSLTLFVVLFTVLVVAFVLGTGISTMIIKQPNSNLNSSEHNGINVPAPTNSPAVSENTSVKLVAVQNGAYLNKANAEDIKNKIREVAIPFTIVDGEMVKVITGIYSEEESLKVIQILNEKQIPNTKVVFDINKSDLCDAEIVEIVNGNIKILNKLSEKNVSAVQTDDFKNWIATSLQAVDAKSKNYNVLQELKNYINGLPKEIGKDKVEENYVFLYNTLKKVIAK